MDSWAENRSKNSSMSKSAKLEKIGQVNAVLRMLANDEDLQDDLKTKDVTTAIKHWTNQNRLSHEEASKLQDNRRVLYVLQKFQVLQHVCKDAGIAVPLDHLLTGQKELSNEFVVKMFGSEFDLSSQGNKNIPSSAAKETDKTLDATKDSAKAKTVENSDLKVPDETKVPVANNEASVAVEAPSAVETKSPPELSEKAKTMLAERAFVRRMQEGTIILVILMCVVLKWFYDK